MYYKTKSINIVGIEGKEITIESNISNGIPTFRIIGLSDRSIQESKDRVICALKNSGITIPSKKIRINLAPSEMYKSGTGIDLAIAICIYCNMNALSQRNIYAFGELNMNGDINLSKGGFQFLEYLSNLQGENIDSCKIYFPKNGEFLHKYFPGLKIHFCANFAETNRHILQKKYAEEFDNNRLKLKKDFTLTQNTLDSIMGNEKAKRALEISAAGGHHILFAGPVGTGKTLLAKSLSSLLPELETNETLEIIKVHNLTSDRNTLANIERPFREVTRNTTISALIGTEQTIGEFTLANKGVLMFDELAEANVKTINQLREPLESKYIVINRARSKVKLPTDFIFVGATNLCPCGKLGSINDSCICTVNEKSRYIKKISQAILNRIDLFVKVNEINLSNKTPNSKVQNYLELKKRINSAREIQKARYTLLNKKSQNFTLNSNLPYEHFDKYIKLTNVAKLTLDKALIQLRMNGRDYVRCIRIAQTIADLEKAQSNNNNSNNLNIIAKSSRNIAKKNSDIISEPNILEAISYRNYLFEN
jgi:magnesium chelatase family protein